MSSVIPEKIYNEAAILYQNNQYDDAIEVLQSSSTNPDMTYLFSRLIIAKIFEEQNRLEEAEQVFVEILETFTNPCPLGLIHYLSFISRTRSMEESLAFFDDLILSESEHITREIFPAVAIGIVWYTSSEAIDQAVRLEIAADIFRKGLASLKGTGGVLKKQRIEMMTGFANFVAYCGNELKLAELELSKFVSSETNNGPTSLIWKVWENILLEFNADLKTIKAMHGMRKLLSAGTTTTDTTSDCAGDDNTTIVSAVSGIVTLSDFPEMNLDSWLLASGNSPTIHSIIEKFQIFKAPSLVPDSAVLESVLGADHVVLEEHVDNRDGGMESTNHVYRPDVTRMLKYNVNDFSEKKFNAAANTTTTSGGMPKQLSNLIALLPSSQPLKCANTQYIADQCIRLLVSVTMPSKHIADETYANVDKRTRSAIEQKFAKPKLAVPIQAAAVVAAPQVLPVAKVKKEENFDPVEYYSQK